MLLLEGIIELKFSPSQAASGVKREVGVTNEENSKFGRCMDICTCIKSKAKLGNIIEMQKVLGKDDVRKTDDRKRIIEKGIAGTVLVPPWC